MLSRLVLAVVVGVVVTLACLLIGALLATINVALAVTIGNFLKSWSGGLGLLAALWYFFAGSTYWPRPRP